MYKGGILYGVLMFKGGYYMAYRCARVGIVWGIDVQGWVLYSVLMCKGGYHMVY